MVTYFKILNFEFHILYVFKAHDEFQVNRMLFTI